jgi:hypothetical protein
MPDRKSDRAGARPEFEVAWYTKELGQALQRELLQKQLDRLSGERRRDGAPEPTQPQPDDAA